MNFKTVNSWLKVRQALCELSRCIKEGGGSVNGLIFRLHPNDDYLQYSIDNGNTWNSNFPVGGNIIPTPHNTLTLGTESNSFNKVYTENVAYNGALRFSASSGYYFSQNTAFNWNQVIGGFFNPGNEFFIQAPSSVPVNSNHRLQVYGTSNLDGDIQVGGHIIPKTNNIYDLGGAGSRFRSIYVNSILGNTSLYIGTTNANTLVFLNANTTSPSAIIGAFQSTTRNFTLQPSGTLLADLGHRFQNHGNAFIKGYIDHEVVTNSPVTTYAVPVSPIVKLNLTGNITLNFTNHTSGMGTTIKLILVQDATSGRLVTWNNVKFPGGLAPTLSSNANATDILTFLWDGTSWMMENFIPDLRY